MSYLKKWKSRLWMVGVTIGVVFLLKGAYLGQLEEIYHKAVAICLECVGIG